MNDNMNIVGKMRFITLVTDLISLIREEDTLRRHHRAYLHVREDIQEYCTMIEAFINAAMEGRCDMPYPSYRTIRVSEEGDTPILHDCRNKDATATIYSEQGNQFIENLMPLIHMHRLAAICNALQNSLDLMDAVHEDCECEVDDDCEPDEYFSD